VWTCGVAGHWQRSLAWATYAFSITSIGFGLVPIAALLLVSGWSIALCVIGLVLRFGSGAEVLAWGILFVVTPLSGVFYPVSALPAVLRPIAQALPTTHATAESCRHRKHHAQTASAMAGARVGIGRESLGRLTAARRRLRMVRPLQRSIAVVPVGGRTARMSPYESISRSPQPIAGGLSCWNG
jgi:ABC-2 type transport system permease protein